MNKPDKLKNYRIIYTIDIPEFISETKTPVHYATIGAYSMGDLLDRIDDLEASLDGVLFEVLSIILLTDDGKPVYNGMGNYTGGVRNG